MQKTKLLKTKNNYNYGTVIFNGYDNYVKLTQYEDYVQLTQYENYGTDEEECTDIIISKEDFLKMAEILRG